VPEAVVTALTVLIVALLYLFLWQVARAIRSHLAPAAGSAAAATLAIVDPPDLAGRLVVVDGPVVAGRSPDADLPLDDAYCSDLHARFSLEAGRLVVRDLGSTNGTFLNEQRLAGPVNPVPGDKVRLGRTIMEVQ
jgi:pSer/pThr/pTyr-binding forkhead associated (FHA) protein